MSELIVMRAVPGSGKSTFAKKLLKNFTDEGKSVKIFSADDFFYRLGDGEYKFDFTKISQAHGECFRQTIEALQSGIDVVIVDNTNLQNWEISPYKLLADSYNYNFSIKDIKADPSKAFERGLHGVPEQSHKRMTETYEKENLLPWWKQDKYLSTTSPEGEPVFEEIKEASILNKIETFYKLAEAKVRARGKCVFPAEHPSVKDNKDHFPINSVAQARNALARAGQFDSVPSWFKGTLTSLKNSIQRAVKKEYPSIEISNG